MGNLSKLDTCHKDLQVLFKEVIKYFDCICTDGHRGEEAQEKAFKEGYSTLHYPHGKHNAMPSLAADVYPAPLNLNPKNAREAEIYKYRMSYFAGQVKAIARTLKSQGLMTHDICWGCD